jgi:predicted nucleic acid-binding protein
MRTSVCLHAQSHETSHGRTEAADRWGAGVCVVRWPSVGIPGRTTKTVAERRVLMDLFTEDEDWFDWSASMVEECAERGELVINSIIYAEVSPQFDSIEALDDALPVDYYRRVDLPWEAGFLAGRALVGYRRSGGGRRSPLPDFYIGAHAAIEGFLLLTRDPARYRKYFPAVRLVAP